MLDILIDTKRSINSTQDRKGWTRGKILRIQDEFLVIVTAEENLPSYVRKNSFEYAKVNTMTSDYDWRLNLKEGDIIDGYDRGKWHPSTILERKVEMINDLPKVEYRIGFRMYTSLFNDWKNFRYIWPEKSISIDNNKKEYFGDSEHLDETIIFSSKRIQMFNTHLSYNTGANDYNRVEEVENYFIDDFIKVPFF